MIALKGYFTSDSYIGILPDGSKMRFPTPGEYAEYMEEIYAQEPLSA